MHVLLENICAELDAISAQILSFIPNDQMFNVVHNNWSFPGVTRTDLSDAAKSLANFIRLRGKDELGNSEEKIGELWRGLQFMRSNLPQNIWGSPQVGVSSYLITLENLRKIIGQALDSDSDFVSLTAVSARRLRALEARLNSIEPRSVKLETMVERIELAYQAADALPTDLQSLEEARDAIADLREKSLEDQRDITSARKHIVEIQSQLQETLRESSAVMAQCRTAYAAATSTGLAAAFSERSAKLDRSIWIWVTGLIVSLSLGFYFGSRQLYSLTSLLDSPGGQNGTLTVHILLSFLSVGAPIWFGWLATKQIGQRFRLSEDYAFKASVSRAYEGYRSEAARIDKDLEAKLLASALNRMDEQPLRLVESTSYGSPWHELASSDLIRDALRSVPGFSNKVVDTAKDMLDTAKGLRAKVKTAPDGTEGSK